MKKFVLALSLSVYGMVCSAAFIPNSLVDLLPAGSNGIQLKGVTTDGNSCVVDLTNYPSLETYSIVAVADGESARLQIGLGHELLEIFDTMNNELVVKTYHKAEEQYSRSTKSTATIEKNEEGFIISISVLEEEKGLLWGWST